MQIQRFCLILGLLLTVLIPDILTAQHIRFQKTYSSREFVPMVKNEQASFYDVETLSDDGFATLGFLNDTSNFSEAFISRYDCTGKPLWTKTLGFSGSPTNTNGGIVEFPNGDIAFSFNLGTGFFRASILVGRISKSGQTMWIKRIGNNTEFGRDIALTADGDLVIAGSTSLYGADSQADDIYLFKMNENGTLLWAKSFGTPNGSYDEGFALKMDHQDRIVVTGRCIADSTFQAFILKADQEGSPILFKTYGYHNQRTNAFDLIVDDDNNYLITGFTTILEDNHASSENDPFLIKVDSNLNTIFTNVYEVSVGADRSTIGEGLCQLDDGGYAIGVSSLGFSNHNVNFPNAPNKNALYVINKDGSLRNAFLYNQHASQYTRVRKSSSGSVLLSGFSRAYTDRNISQGLIIKTDNRFFSGCFDIDVTREIVRYSPPWQIADYNYLSRSDFRVLDYINYRDSSLKQFVLCEDIPLLTPEFEGPDSTCAGMIYFTNQSSGPGSHFWTVNSDTIQSNWDLEYNFTEAGTYEIGLHLKFSCIIKSFSKNITVLPLARDTINATVCAGENYTFRDSIYTKQGFYNIRISTPGSLCDSVIVLNLNIQSEAIITEEHFLCGKEIELYGNKYSSEGEYELKYKSILGCDSLLRKLIVKKFYDSTAVELDLDTIKFCGSYSYKSTTFNKAGTYHRIPVDTLEDCRIEYISFILVDICRCLEFPNVISISGEELNRSFRPHLICPENIYNYNLKIYNRWGQLVYKTEDMNAAWDGNFNGKPAPMDTYGFSCTYSIKYSDEDVQSRHEKASFSLIR